MRGTLFRGSIDSTEVRRPGDGPSPRHFDRRLVLSGSASRVRHPVTEAWSYFVHHRLIAADEWLFSLILRAVAQQVVINDCERSHAYFPRCSRGLLVRRAAGLCGVWSGRRRPARGERCPRSERNERRPGADGANGANGANGGPGSEERSERKDSAHHDVERAGGRELPRRRQAHRYGHRRKREMASSIRTRRTRRRTSATEHRERTRRTARQRGSGRP